MQTTPLIALSLGSNMGNSALLLTQALTGVGEFLSQMRVSAFYRSTPIDVPPELAGQPDFLNCMAVGHFAGTPPELLAHCQQLETAAARTRAVPKGPRTLDIDIVVFGDLCQADTHLTLPHPRYRQRRFVLQPLADVWPTFTCPQTGESLSALLAMVQGQGLEKLA
jgi:2-amino-4-hydroxy-6-hydroxymethyldihydropteridine diphosphokinase